jgi:hypothetical protein
MAQDDRKITRPSLGTLLSSSLQRAKYTGNLALPRRQIQRQTKANEALTV